jgi:predicted transcriptional regulator
MSSPSSRQLNHRTQLLLDNDLHRRLRETATQRGISMGALIREAIAEKLAQARDQRPDAFKRLLDAEPMAVEDWPEMKKELRDSRYAKVAKLYGEDQ